MQIDKFIDPELLVDNASFTVDEEIRHDFTDEELIELKEEYFELSKMVDVRDEAMKEFKVIMTMDYSDQDIKSAILEGFAKEDYGDTGIKALKAKSKTLLNNINKGYQIEAAQLFAVPYYEIGRMAFYKEDGNYIYDRTMKADEKQMTITTKMRSIS